MMKMLPIIIIIGMCMLLLSQFVMARQETTFTNGKSIDNLSYSANGNITRFINISTDANFTGGTVTIEGFIKSPVKSEEFGNKLSYVNVSFDSVSNVPYWSHLINWTNSSNSSSTYVNEDNQNFDINLTFSVSKNVTTVRYSYFIAAHGNLNPDDWNITLLEFNYESSGFVVVKNRFIDNINGTSGEGTCIIERVNLSKTYNKTSGVKKLKINIDASDDRFTGDQVLDTGTCDGSSIGSTVFELVNFTYSNGTYPTNITVDSTNDSLVEYANSSVFDSEKTVDLNITQLNNWLNSNCTFGYCLLPVRFQSITSGLLEVSNININWFDIVNPNITSNTTTATMTVDTASDFVLNVSDFTSNVTSVILELTDSNSNPTNLTMVLSEGTAEANTESKWTRSFVGQTPIGVWEAQYFVTDSDSNTLDSGKSLIIVTNPPTTPGGSGGGGGGGSSTVIISGNVSTIIDFGALEAVITILRDPKGETIKVQELVIKNIGDLKFSGNIIVEGDASEFVTAEICGFNDGNCEISNIQISAGETAILRLTHDIPENVGVGYEGIIKLTESGPAQTSEIFELPVGANRLPGFSIGKKISDGLGIEDSIFGVVILVFGLFGLVFVGFDILRR